MSGVIHVVAHARAAPSAREWVLARALHDAGRPHIIVAGDADDDVTRLLGTRLRLVRGLASASVRAPRRLAQDAACLLDLTRVIDVLVDRLRSPVVLHTHGEHARASVLGRLAARALRGVVNVYAGPARDTLGADVFVSTAPGEIHEDARARGIVDGIDAASYAALLELDDAERRRRRESRGVARGASLVVTDAAGEPLLAAWRARHPRADILLELERGSPGTSRGAPPRDDSDVLGIADAALVVKPSLRDVLAVVASGVPLVVVGAAPSVAAAASWAKRVTFLDANASAGDVDAALSRLFAAKPIAASTRARHARLPRELTVTGMVEAWRELYDELVGPPRPTGEMARRRPMRRRR